MPSFKCPYPHISRYSSSANLPPFHGQGRLYDICTDMIGRKRKFVKLSFEFFCDLNFLDQIAITAVRCVRAGCLKSGLNPYQVFRRLFQYVEKNEILKSQFYQNHHWRTA